MELTYPSPDGKREARLVIAGEIRFGPQYFSLILDGKKLPERSFGEGLLWSPDSRYLAVQEWMTTEESDGPITRALVIDAARSLQCVLAQANGWVEVDAEIFKNDLAARTDWKKLV